MNARNARAFRKHANEAVRQVAPAINAALDNEATTRYRVEQLEEKIAEMCRMLDEREKQRRILLRGFWGRVRWLFLGR